MKREKNVWLNKLVVSSIVLGVIIKFLTIPLTYAVELPEYKFQENQRKSLNKGERWAVLCMDFDIEVEEKKVKVKGTMVVVQYNATIICHSEGNKKAYFTCRADSVPKSGDLVVWCE